MPKFNVQFSDRAYGTLQMLSGRLGVSMADTLRESMSILWFIVREIDAGNHIAIRRGKEWSELVLPNLEPDPRLDELESQVERGELPHGEDAEARRILGLEEKK